MGPDMPLRDAVNFTCAMTCVSAAGIQAGTASSIHRLTAPFSIKYMYLVPPSQHALTLNIPVLLPQNLLPLIFLVYVLNPEIPTQMHNTHFYTHWPVAYLITSHGCPKGLKPHNIITWVLRQPPMPWGAETSHPVVTGHQTHCCRCCLSGGQNLYHGWKYRALSDGWTIGPPAERE
jgi:hypothetical protein